VTVIGLVNAGGAHDSAPLDDVVAVGAVVVVVGATVVEVLDVVVLGATVVGVLDATVVDVDGAAVVDVVDVDLGPPRPLFGAAAVGWARATMLAIAAAERTNLFPCNMGGAP
jgi:ACT domain-containing protein